MHLELPFPPSVNSAWRMGWTFDGRRQMQLSKKQRQYRGEVQGILMERRPYEKFICPVSVHVQLYMPDKRIRDIDNHLKAIFDALTAAVVWLDDSQVDRILVERMGVEKGGRAVVDIKPMEKTNASQKRKN